MCLVNRQGISGSNLVAREAGGSNEAVGGGGDIQPVRLSSRVMRQRASPSKTVAASVSSHGGVAGDLPTDESPVADKEPHVIGWHHGVDSRTSAPSAREI
jgi:hypothetical protein